MLDEEYKRFCVDNKFINLTEMETQILSYLIDNRHRRTSTKALSRAIYGMKPYTNSMGVITRRRIMLLRNKLKDYVEIDNSVGAGYIIRYKGEK